jgi:hypothetical protein
MTNALNGACSRYGGQERCLQGFGWGSMRGRDQLEDTDADGKIILRRMFKEEDWGGLV